MTSVQGNLVDIHSKTIYSAQLLVEDGRIKEVNKLNQSVERYILPGFVDSHIHIESSLLTPENFANIAISHGTIATVSDPHEIANVCGLDGVEFMIRNGSKAPLKFCWTAPSCVPATSFETSGATLEALELDQLLKRQEIVALGEMMNYPGVIYKDPKVIEKCRIANERSKVIDGHAPGLTGENLISYISAGISTDHECSTLEEALEKLYLGMKILIREGSSAKNFEALSPLLRSHPDSVMLCSDDLHADDLIRGHINLLVKRALSENVPLFDVLSAVSVNPVQHYGLPVGLLRIDDPADFIVVDNLDDFNVMETWNNGAMVYKKGESPSHIFSLESINKFNSSYVSTGDLNIELQGSKVRVMEVEEGSIATNVSVLEIGHDFESFLNQNGILKLYVKDRYTDKYLGKALVRGLGNLNGAVASTIAHDSHNIIAVGNSLEHIKNAINLVIENNGGISFVSSGVKEILPLPVAGLMSDKAADVVSEKYERIIQLARQHGSVLKSPLMTLSFLALLVIPSLKLSDRGLFDVNTFSFTDLFVD